MYSGICILIDSLQKHFSVHMPICLVLYEHNDATHTY